MHPKSDAEVPWDSFVRAMDPVLQRAARGFRIRHKRALALGSPARVSTPAGDVIRFPIEVRGGEREYAVATVFVKGELKRFYDETRLEQIAREAVEEAEKHPLTPPAKPGSLVLNYPS